VDARNSRKLFVTTPSDREIVLQRTFDAPRELVYGAWTKAEHVRKWYGCAIFELVVCELDFRVGGHYRFTMRTPEGAEHTMTGVYREIVRPARIVCSEHYETEGFRTEDALVTILFEEENGRTTLTSTVLHPNRAQRDGHLDSGMEQGAGETYGRLADFVATLAPA
jgi:uncharacterized protein YndB with AHSA1/START domain